MNKNITLKGVVLSEKAAFIGGNRVYSFYVEGLANKHMISDAIFAKYNVRPSKINIVRVGTRQTKNSRKKTITERGYKKALVTLPVGQAIEFV